MDLDKINAMWKVDCKIDNVMLDESSIKIPQLHQKYLTLHSEFTILIKKKRLDLKKAEHYKYLFYAGKGPPEAYEDKPFPYKLLKNEARDWVQVDDDIQAIELKIEYYCATINTLTEILKQINQMSFNIKNCIEWRRFTGGV